MMRRVVDLALHPRWIIPVVPRGQVLNKLSVIIDKGLIVDMLPKEACDKKYNPRRNVDLPTHVLLPGFVNAHTHTAMYLFKGYGDDNELSDWLQHYIWPMEEMYISPEFISDGMKCGCAEMLRSGTTCFNDMYYLPEESAELVNQIGMRAVIGLMGRDKNGSQDGLISILKKGNHPYPLVHYGIGPHSPYLYDDQSLCNIKRICNEYNVLMHIHVQETRDELENSIAGNHAGSNCHRSDAKCSPIQNMANLNLLHKTCCAHCVHVLDSDIELLSKHQASVVHCPHSNLKLGSGIAPVQRMLDTGVNVCLGTDGASSNNNLDMLNEMRTAALLGPIASGHAQSVNAVTALEMATINGAKALGLENEIGSIEIDKCADLIAIDLNQIETMPLNSLFSSIVYAAGREQITHVWVNGKCLLDERKLTTIDVKECCQKAKKWSKLFRDNNPYNARLSPDPCSSPF